MSVPVYGHSRSCTRGRSTEINATQAYGWGWSFPWIEVRDLSHTAK